MDEKQREALQELLKLLSEKPEIVERLTITVKPNKNNGKGKSK